MNGSLAALANVPVTIQKASGEVKVILASGRPFFSSQCSFVKFQHGFGPGPEFRAIVLEIATKYVEEFPTL